MPFISLRKFLSPPSFMKFSIFLNQEKMLDFVKCFFYMYRDKLVVFLMVCYYDELKFDFFEREWPETTQAYYITACKSSVH